MCEDDGRSRTNVNRFQFTFLSFKENCYEVLQNAKIETCKCSDEVFNDAFYFQQKQFDEIQSWERNTNNYPLFLIFWGFFLAFSSYHMSIIKLSVKVQFVPLMNLSEKLSTSVTRVKTHNYNVRIIRNLPNNSKGNY